MHQDSTTLEIITRGQGLYEFTGGVCSWLDTVGMTQGLLTVFCRHTSASLTIQENADPDVMHDLQSFFRALVREGPSLYRHAQEGPDDMPAHIRSVLTDVSLSLPVIDAQAVLGTWQGLYLFEHRAHTQRREVVLHVMGS